MESSISKACGGDQDLEDFSDANVMIVRNMLEGVDPITGKPSDERGAKMVVNIASIHIPGFCKASKMPGATAYKNGYDLGKFRIGGSPPKPKTREIVDEALPLDFPQNPANTYFGAVELNGAGIRFYGDICLVLKKDAVPDNTVILDRNSFDLHRAPLRTRIDKQPKPDQSRKDEALKMAGRWNPDLGRMAALMVFARMGHRPRLCTTGQISSSVREDEDYIEVLKHGSFGAGDLVEARISSADAACDAHTGDRIRSGPVPRFEALMLRRRHQQAEKELRACGLPFRIIATHGRLKS